MIIAMLQDGAESVKLVASCRRAACLAIIVRLFCGGLKEICYDAREFS